MMGGAISWVRGAQLAGNVVEAPEFDPSLEKSSCPTSSQPPPLRKLADGEFATNGAQTRGYEMDVRRRQEADSPIRSHNTVRDRRDSEPEQMFFTPMDSSGVSFSQDFRSSDRTGQCSRSASLSSPKLRNSNITSVDRQPSDNTTTPRERMPSRLTFDERSTMRRNSKSKNRQQTSRVHKRNSEQGESEHTMNVCWHEDLNSDSSCDEITEPDEHMQHSTTPSTSRETHGRDSNKKADTPYPQVRRRVSPCLKRHGRQGRSSSPSSTSSDTDSYIASAQPHSKHFLKAPKFDGTTCFETFYAQFQNCAQYNGWRRSEQLTFLKAALIGEAGQVLWDSDESVTSSLNRITKLLQNRFGGAARADKYRMELRSRKRQAGETLEKLHQDIRRYMALAFPDADQQTRETIACDYFIDAMGDPDFALKIRERNPKSLDAALLIAQQLEVWSKDSRWPRSHNQVRREKSIVRGVDSSDDVVHFMDRIDQSLKELECKMEGNNRERINSKQSVADDNVQERLASKKASKIRCYNCKQEGHIARECPVSNRSRQRKATESPQSSDENKQNIRGLSKDHKSVYIPVMIKRNRLQCTLDTGSDVTVLPMQMATKFKLKLTQSNTERLKAANGTDIIINASTTVPLVVGGCTIETTALVSRDVCEFILGNDWLTAHRCIWNFQQCQIRIDNGSWIQLSTRRTSVCGRVFVAEDITLPPRAQCNIPARIAISKPNYYISETLMESKQLKSGVYVGRTVLPSGSRHDIRVCLLNVTAQEQRVFKDQCLGPALLVTKSISGAEPDDFRSSEADINSPTAVTDELFTKIIDKFPKELSTEQKEAFVSLLRKFTDIFSRDDYDIGRTPLVEHYIDTGDHRPIRQQLRRHPAAHLELIDEHVEQMLRNDIIEPAASPWASNIVLVRKRDGGLRFCIDYRAVNSVTYKDTYPLPLIDTCLDTLQGASWFSTLDLRAGYYNIPVAKRDRDKTAFLTRRGCWRFTVMPFGLTCAPSVFQRLMDLVLSGLSYEICLVYLDDIILFSRTFEEHLCRLELVFERLRNAKLKLKPSKCSFMQRRVAFLGHIISEHGVEVQPEKTETVVKWPTPRSIHDVRSFVGLCGYYRRFVAGFANVAAPLYALTKKGAHFQWTQQCEAAFQTLKRSLTQAPILSLPNNTDVYILDTDASDMGLGAVLSQVQNGEEKVIAYASRTLSKPERNYDTTRKELLAVVYGLKQYRQYLLGRMFTIRSDHAALSWLRKTPEPMPQLARWLTFIEEFNFKIEHRAGRSHQNADALSRRPNNNIEDITELTDNYEGASQRRHQVAAINHDTTTTMRSIENLPMADLLAGENVAMEQQKDLDIGPILRMKQCQDDQPSIDQLLLEPEPVKKYWSQWDRLLVRNGLLYRRCYEKGRQQNILQLILPASLKEEAIRRCHSGMVGGHMGLRKTIEQVHRRFYWLTWRGDISRYCRRCIACCSYHRGKLARTAPLQPIEAGAPFERLSIDLTGPHCKSDRGHIWILTCVDPYTKWAEAFPLRNKEAETVARVLVEQVFTRFGTPIALLSDRGNEVDSTIMRSVCQLLEIDKLRTTSYKPSTNAAVERFHRTLNSMLGKVVSENQRDWDTKLPFVMAAYRSSCHTSTNYSPNFLVLGREVRAPLDVVLNLPTEETTSLRYDDYVDKLMQTLRYAYRLVREQLGRSAERAKRYYDLRVRPSRYTSGQWVYCYNPRHYQGRQDKWSRKFSGPYLILEVLPPVNLKIQRSPKSKPFIVHFDKVKPWIGDAPKSWIPDEVDSEHFTVLESLPAVIPESSEASFDIQSNSVDLSKYTVDEPLPVADVYEVDESLPPRPQRIRKRPVHLSGFV